MSITPRLFSHDSVLPLDQFVLSTEAHPVPILGKGADKGAHTFAHLSISCCWCTHVFLMIFLMIFTILKFLGHRDDRMTWYFQRNACTV